jgi:outer membrane protein assembly factor BamB
MYRGDLARDGHPLAATLDETEALHLRLAWSEDLGGAVDGSPAVSAGLVVAGSANGALAAFNATSGSEVWKKSGLGPITGSPTIAAGRVFVGSLDGHVRAFNLAEGRDIWDWKAPGDQPAIWSSPTFDGGRVLVGIGSQVGDQPLEVGRMVALDGATGRELWTLCTMPGCSAGGGVWSTAAIDQSGRGFVGVGNPVDGVVAFGASSGVRLWQLSFYADQSRDLDVGASPSIVSFGGREALAIGSTGGVFKLVDAATGTVIWTRDLVNGSAVHGLIASPAYDGTSIFIGSASPPTGMFALRPGGVTAWMHGTALPVYSSPAAARGVLVFGTGAVFGDLATGSVEALSTADGHALWTYATHSAVRGSPAIAGSTVFAGDYGGELMAFRPSS